MHINKSTFMTVLALAVIGVGVSACETVEGAGRDIEHAGESMQDASKDAQR